LNFFDIRVTCSQRGEPTKHHRPRHNIKILIPGCPNLLLVICNQNIRSIAATNQLADAVSACISAASAEFSIQRQQVLMKAASYGKAFCPDADPAEFVDTARKLRVLNDVRQSNIALPLTIQQYNRLTPEVLVNRLTIRNHHFLALKICELLKLKNERVLVHWACEKVKRMAALNLSDEEISATVRRRLEPYGRVSYLEIATAAYHMSRRRLATMILDMEQHAADQVPLLLRGHGPNLFDLDPSGAVQAGYGSLLSSRAHACRGGGLAQGFLSQQGYRLR
jgi:hypothetical protein